VNNDAIDERSSDVSRRSPSESISERLEAFPDAPAEPISLKRRKSIDEINEKVYLEAEKRKDTLLPNFYTQRLPQYLNDLNDITELNDWSILKVYSNELLSKAAKNPLPGTKTYFGIIEALLSMAQNIVLHGLQPRLPVPVYKCGDFEAIDHTEIDNLKSIHSLMNEYVSSQKNQTPLSIAVFGPPGLGKSFAIKAIAQALQDQGSTIDKMEFNLSQFSDVRALAQSFYQIRDKTLPGSVPLVFWDEFDTKELYWLPYFLAPMQDGIFQEGSISHKIGRSIFVFAGGVYHKMANFETKAADNPSLKAIDFLSRLQGYVDIPELDFLDEHKMPGTIIRRAILLRNLLLKNAPEIKRGKDIDIDVGIVRAFLTIDQFKHGARSMESIIKMSALHGRSKFDRSSLPTSLQLRLHVDEKQFFTNMYDRDAKSSGWDEAQRSARQEEPATART